MAKILANKGSLNHSKLIKLRQKLDFYKEELATIDTKYDDVIAKRLDKFLIKCNNKIEKVAFEACDKEAYAQDVLDSKLQKYDIKAYMEQRAINHGAAKQILKLSAKGQPFGFVLVKRAKQMDALNKKRAKYVRSLEKEKDSFIKKHQTTFAVEYNLQKERYEKEYDAYKAELEKTYGSKIAKEKGALTVKIGKIEKELKSIMAKSKVKYSLPDDVLLSVKGLKMYFGGLRAVDDLNFEVKKGEIFGLIGPNGAGKTTVFNCITQFYKPTAGELLFVTRDGEAISLTDYKVHDIILRGIARTFQNIEIVKEVSVLENLLIAATRRYSSSLFTQMFHLPGLLKEEKVIRAKADKILKYMDLYAYRDRLAWGLPYGVLKRIEIARALMCNPQLIILDEPAAGLNESETADLARMINKIRDDFDCTILLVEHDMSLVMSICDHICAISFGRKLADGTPAEVQASKEVQEAYLGVGGE